MTPDPTVGGTLSQALYLAGEFAFKWVPGSFVSITGGAPDQSFPPPTAITEPLSVPQMIDYLQTASAPGVYDRLFHGWSTFVALSMIFTLGMVAIIIYCSIRMFQIRQLERRKFASHQHPVASHDVPKALLRWHHILEEVRSDSERSWRLAILEADIMLNELLDSLGYKGETMADKMRSADKATFQTLDLAWEAHKFRNKIAHETRENALNSRDVHRVIAMYERIFKEFRFVE